MSNDEDKTIDDLILNGALEVSGIDSKNGEFRYSFTPKIKEIMPELYEEHLLFVYSEIMKLWEMGYLNIDFLSDHPNVALTEKALDNNEIENMSDEEKWSLAEVKRILIN